MAKSSMILEIETIRYGPIFDGRASAAVKEWLDTTKMEVAEIGADWIRLAAESMDRSGRGGTGRAAAGVEVSRFGAMNDVRVFGAMVTGEVWWPWLEGDSKRNVRSRFKGYHVFRLTRLRLRRIVTSIAQKNLQAFIEQMGGQIL